jgi:hypothetical protein
MVTHLEGVRRSADGEALLEACGGLEEEIRGWQGAFDPGRVPGLPHAARRCVEARIQEAAVLSAMDRVRSRLRELAASPLVTRDPDLQRLVGDVVEEVERIRRAEQEPPEDRLGEVELGEVTASGGLRGGEMKSAMAERVHQLRLCYQAALGRDRELSGAITVRFVVGPGGSVTSVSNGEPDALDPAMVSCVLQTIAGRLYPLPRGEAAVVTCPMRFSPVDPDEPLR